MANKYLAKKCEYNGIEFDSKKELRRYVILEEMVKHGDIKNLQRQVRYELIPQHREPSTLNSKGKEVLGKVIERRCDYVADFQYEKNGEIVVEDVKGYRQGGAYAVFSIKRKLMLDRYGIKVKEV